MSSLVTYHSHLAWLQVLISTQAGIFHAGNIHNTASLCNLPRIQWPDRILQPSSLLGSTFSQPSSTSLSLEHLCWPRLKWATRFKGHCTGRSQRDRCAPTAWLHTSPFSSYALSFICSTFFFLRLFSFYFFFAVHAAVLWAMSCSPLGNLLSATSFIHWALLPQYSLIHINF